MPIVTSDLTAKGAITAAGPGPWNQRTTLLSSIEAVVKGQGTVNAIIDVEVSNDGISPCDTPAATITLGGANEAADGFLMNANWRYVRLNVISITGTGAVVTGLMGT